MNKEQIRISKFLSYVLRHKPESIGISLDGEGWADLDALIHSANQQGMRLTGELIAELVECNDKHRFHLDLGNKRIRANQGHSIAVDLGLKPEIPPDPLYHGTAARFVDSILADGLQPKRRQYVHLSVDYATAVIVGKRHGKPTVLKIDTEMMSKNRHLFFLSKNGVWLVNHVPPEFISIVDVS